MPEVGFCFVFRFLSCLVFSKLSGSLVRYLLLILKCFQPLSLQIFRFLHFLFLLWYSSCGYYIFWYCLIVLRCFVLFFFFLFSSLHFSLGSLYQPVLKFFDSFLGCIKSTDEPLHWRHSSFLSLNVLIYSFSFWFFLRVSFSVYITHYSCILSTFSTSALNTLIIVILDFSLIIPSNSVSHLNLVLMIAYLFRRCFFLPFCNAFWFFVDSLTSVIR